MSYGTALKKARTPHLPAATELSRTFTTLRNDSGGAAGLWVTHDCEQPRRVAARRLVIAQSRVVEATLCTTSRLTMATLPYRHCWSCLTERYR